MDYRLGGSLFFPDDQHFAFIASFKNNILSAFTGFHSSAKALQFDLDSVGFIISN